jgi:hypothetical protein
VYLPSSTTPMIDWILTRKEKWQLNAAIFIGKNLEAN